MATTFVVAAGGAATVAAALFSGTVQPGAISNEILSLALAALTSIAVASASALDG
ncbi:hypothetical protein GGC47_005236 [Bosea sp. OAE752]|jgi:hypothetical protein|uniref:Uncharacterized protein n=1 Tax=Bosea spartocytisi TaxID=2773451 RepID=A0A927HYR0_9HYPH|nr:MULTISPECIES: hypothetical protein [Bosea]MBD3845474.1 hypothetical protein [Bosea spartocytisi]MCT4472645.1 hypothetical protein [Bosea spartocytisi]